MFGGVRIGVKRNGIIADGNFLNHHPDPVSSANCRDLIRLVRENKADLGFGFDGDGDRLGIVDNEVRIIWGDQLMILYWRAILAKHPGTTCIIEVKCSQALIEEVKRMGGIPLIYKTGHSLIKSKMREINAVFTGEMSGHMFFADEYYGYDDAFYAAGRLLRILSNTVKTYLSCWPLSRITHPLPKPGCLAVTSKILGCPGNPGKVSREIRNY